MRNVCFFVIIAALVFVQANPSFNTTILQDQDLARKDSIWFASNPQSLPQWQTLEEKKMVEQGRYSYTDPSIVFQAPPAPVRNIAEYERMEGVFIRHPLGIPTTLVKEMAKDVTVYCITTNSQSAKSSFQSAGVPMDKVKFINQSTDSYWTRDYCPWWIVDGNNKIGIVDFEYNRPRPKDNKVNSYLDEEFNVPYYKMNIRTAGGNYMCDGYNLASSTKLVIKENSSSQNKVATAHKDYLGIKNLHLVDDPNLGSSIDHIDCWGKFLTPDKIMIRRVPQGNSDFNALEKAADYWKNQTSSYGTKYKIYRVTGTGSREAYTNCTMLNDKVLLPLGGSSNDNAAIDAYKKALPGYQVLGFTNNGQSWQSTDALHCRTKGVPDRNMLYLSHIPLHDTVESNNGEGYKVEATIIAYSNKSIIEDSVRIFYKPEGSSIFSSVKMKKVKGDTYKGTIPQPSLSVKMSYYVHAADMSSRSENHPFIGAPGAHEFYAKSLGTFTQMPKNLNNVHAVFQNIPNPFVSNTTIYYYVKNVATTASMTIYNNQGKRIRSWHIEKPISSIAWDGTDSHNKRVATGIYFCTFRNGSFTETKKMNIVRSQ